MFVHWRCLIYGPARGFVGSRGTSSDWPAAISRVRRVARAIAPPIEQPPPLRRQSVATRRRVRVLYVCSSSDVTWSRRRRRAAHLNTLQSRLRRPRCDIIRII